MKKASEQLIEYFEEAEGNKIARFHKANEKFERLHRIKAPFANYYSFAAAYRYHYHSQIKN